MLGAAEAVVKQRETVKERAPEPSENPLRGLGDLDVRSEHQAKLARKRSSSIAPPGRAVGPVEEGRRPVGPLAESLWIAVRPLVGGELGIGVDVSAGKGRSWGQEPSRHRCDLRGLGLDRGGAGRSCLLSLSRHFAYLCGIPGSCAAVGHPRAAQVTAPRGVRKGWWLQRMYGRLRLPLGKLMSARPPGWAHTSAFRGAAASRPTALGPS